MNIELALRQISNWSIVAALISGLLFRRTLSRDSKLIFLLVVAATIPQLINALAHNLPIKGLIYNLYTVVEFCILYVFFYSKLAAYRIKYLQIASLVLFSISSLYFIKTERITLEFVSEWVSVTNLIYLVWVMVFVKNSLEQNDGEINPRDSSTFYLLGIFLYATGTLLYFSIDGYIRGHPNSILERLDFVHDVINISLYSFFGVGFYLDDLKKTV